MNDMTFDSVAMALMIFLLGSWLVSMICVLLLIWRTDRRNEDQEREFDL